VTPAFEDVPPASLWPGFSVDNQGMWWQLRCINCTKATSLASMNEPLIDQLVREHQCGPPLSTHWREGVSLGAARARALTSYAMDVEQMANGLGAEPDVRAALDRLGAAVESHRQAADDIVERYDRYARQSLGVGMSDDRMPTICPSCSEAIPAAEYMEHRRRCQADVVADNQRLSLGAEPLDARRTVSDPENIVEISVAEVCRLGALGLPRQPVTGALPVGVVWAPGAMCLSHLVDQRRDGRLVEQLGLDEVGVVVYAWTDIAACGECPAGPEARP